MATRTAPLRRGTPNAKPRGTARARNGSAPLAQDEEMNPFFIAQAQLDQAAQKLRLWPPSTVMLAPFTRLAWAEHRKTTTAATSSGVPSRPSG